MLHGRDVVHALGHHPRQFLEARKAIKFERVKGAAFDFCLRLQLGDLGGHLRFCLNLDFAYLMAQANDVIGQFQQRGLQGAHFAFDAGTRNSDFTGFVDQAVDEVGTDT